jgi:hypothetical protein
VPALNDEYFPAELTHADYPRLIPEGQTIDTVASGNILVAYNWPKDTERYQVLARFTQEFFDKFEELRKAPRHPKWREASPRTEFPLMKRFEPAQKWLDDHQEKNGTVAGADKATQKDFDAFLSSSGDGAADEKKRERLFREFTEWQRRAAAQ